MNLLIPELQKLLSQKESPGLIRIQASAGSGKTYTLTLCYLIILNNLPPSPKALSSILAITFTNNAAQEMKERILNKLKSIALIPKYRDEDAEFISKAIDLTPEKASNWVEIIIKNYNYFRVSTIDSFLYNILKGIALEHGTRPDLKVETNIDWLIEAAFEELIGKAKSNDTLLTLFLNCVDTFLRIQGKNGFFVEREILTIFKSIFENYRHQIRIHKSKSHCYKNIDMLKDSILSVCKDMVDIIITNDIKLVRNNLNYLKDPLNNFDKSIFSKNSISEVVAKKSQNKVTEELDQLFLKLKDLRDDYLYQKAIHKVKAYTEFFHSMMDELEKLKDKTGIIPMGTWLDMALKYLSNDSIPAIYAILGGEIRYILMDEFQDTSLAQWQVLKPLVENALSEGGKFVYVGDPKQSIYLWRGADPQLFFDLNNSLNFHNISLSLDYNYRSNPQVIEFNNELYTKLLSDSGINIIGHLSFGNPNNDEGETLEDLNSLKDSVCRFYGDVVQKYPSFKGSNCSELHSLVSNIEIRNVNSNEEILCNILSILEELVSKGIALKDIAIIARHNNKIEEISEFLWEKGYPCITKNSLNILNSTIVIGLINMLRFLKYPKDKLALIKFLTSGIFEGVSEEEIYLSLIDQIGSVENIIFKKYPNVLFKIKNLLGLRNILTPYLLVVNVLNSENLLSRYPKDSIFLLRFLDIVLAMESEGILCIEEFLERLETEERRIGAIEGIDAVRLLSIHDCKGLEFPVVILAFANWKPNTEQIILLKEGILAYVKAPYPKAVEKRVGEDKVRATIEALNLLYVATTRAKKHLYVLIQRSKRATVGDLFS